MTADADDAVPPLSALATAGDVKFHLQHLLDAKEKQLQQAGTLGQRVLAQQMELEERIRQIQEHDADKADDDELDPDARDRYRDLAETILAWDTENAQLSAAFGGSAKRYINGKTPPSPELAFADLPREEPERTKASGSTAAQSRRAKNAAHRADDVEFAFEIGSGLLTEVRRLQSLLGERDKAIQDMKEEKDDLEKSVEALRTALRQQEQSADKYKEENWNLEVSLQELRAQLTEYQSSTQRLESEQKRLNKLLAASRDAGDQHKNESDRLQNIIEDMKSKHETDIAQARKHAAGLARDKSDLQQSVDTLKTELARTNRKLPRFGSPLTPGAGQVKDFVTPAGTERDDAGDLFSTTTGGASTNRRKYDTSALFPADSLGNEYPDSPDTSPLRRPFLAPNHPSNEIETLQQRLAHAQRQINTLKGSLNREKQLRIRLEATTSQGPTSEHEDDDQHMEEEEENVPESYSKPRSARRGGTPSKAGGLRGQRRGRGRGGGITLIQRLGMAAGSPASDGDENEDARDSSPPPPVPPIHFTQDEDEENFFNTSVVAATKDRRRDDHDGEEEEEASRSPSPPAPSSNRASIEGMDPVFANILRRVPSNGSYTSGSPLRHSLLSRRGSSSSARRSRGSVVGGSGGRGTRRPRGGVPFKEARPPSLVNDQPEALAAELGLGGAGAVGSASSSPMKMFGGGEERAAGFDDSIREEEEELAAWRKEVIGDDNEEEVEEVEMKEFGCQTEPPEEMEEEKTMRVVEDSVPLVTVEFGVQAEPVEEKKVMAEVQMQTEVVKPVFVDSAMETDPLPEHNKPSGLPYEGMRRTTLTQSDMSFSSLKSGDHTITRSFLARGQSPEFDEGEETETGAETETDADADYYDARQSIAMTTPSAQFSESREDFHSIMTVSDHDYLDSSDEDDDDESVKASRTNSAGASRASVVGAGIGAGMIVGRAVGGVHVDPNGGRGSGSASPSVASFYTGHQAPPVVTYETVGVSADLYEEPEPVVIIKEVEKRVEVPVEVPVRVEVPVEVRVEVPVPVEVKVPVEVPVEVKVPVEVPVLVKEPKPEVKEMEIQTDEVPEPEQVTIIAQAPPPPPLRQVAEQSVQVTPPVSSLSGPVFVPPGMAAPVPTSPGLHRVGSTGQQQQQFQFVLPSPPSGGTAPVQKAEVTGAAALLSRASRLSTSDRRQSIDSTISSIAGDVAARPTQPPSGGLLLNAVDKSKPPMMVLPPPPKAPPPPNSMPPPSFIPERRHPHPLNLPPHSGDGPPPRPSSPPPPELIQRATTPTFGSVLSVPSPFGGSIRQQQQQQGSTSTSVVGLRQLPSTSSFRAAIAAGTVSNVHVERRQFSTTSLVPSERSGAASPRSSISSSDHQHHSQQQQQQQRSRRMTEAPSTPNKTADTTPRANGQATDPAIIHAITQTMIGEFLYKYTRKAIGRGYGERRHRRFFWVHPYTKTLYWSSADPGSSNVSESSAKSAYIEGVRSVLDPNPMPPGLYQYSVVVSTPQREMKITAPTKERHDIWLNALKYLLSRPSPNMLGMGNGTILEKSPGEFFTDDDRDHRRPRLLSSPQSLRSSRGGTPGETWNTTPRGKRSRSQLSVKGSVGKRSGTPALEYLRWNGPESPYSPSKSFVDVPGQGQDEDDLDFELHDESLSDGGFEGLENVRACCDGRHTVGHSGKHHHHHHHHHHHPHPIQQLQLQAHAHTAPLSTKRQSTDNNQHLDPNQMEIGRPVSPAWSLRSRPGSVQSQEGTGGGGFFSWGRGEGSRLRFGSRRSTKTSTAPPVD